MEVYNSQYEAEVEVDLNSMDRFIIVYLRQTISATQTLYHWYALPLSPTLCLFFSLSLSIYIYI